MQHYYLFVTKDKLFQLSLRVSRYHNYIEVGYFFIVLLYVEMNTFIFPLDEHVTFKVA